MTSDIKFSVTVPAYKAQFLAECIDSILAQTYKNFELIIVNDASPQDLDSIVSKYDDPRIRYYKNEVGFGAEHVVGNWNKCLEYATGDYIICMGDDDKLLPHCLEEYVKLIEKYPGLGVYHGWTEVIDEDGVITNIFPPLPEWESVYSLIYSRLYGRAEFIGDCLFDVELLREHGGFYNLDYAWGSDDMTSFIAASKAGIAHTQVPIFQYRQNRQSISSSSHNREKLNSITLEYKWVRQFLAKAPITYDTTAMAFRDVCLKNLPSLYKGNVVYYMKLDFGTSSKLQSVYYWIHCRAFYHLTIKEIIKSLLKSIA